MELDRERILQLLEVLKSSRLSELAVTEDGVRIRLARLPESQVVAVAPPAMAQSAPAVGPVPGAVSEPAEAPVSATPADGDVTVASRFVGLFRRSRKPGDAPLAEVGDAVSADQVLGFVEVLRKPMEVISPVAGTIAEVLHEEGSSVQYGDPLFTITA